MNRKRKTLVVAIVGLVMLGCGLVTSVSAVKPPFHKPRYDPQPGYPDAVMIIPGFVYNPSYPKPWCYWNIMDRSDASFILVGWFNWVDEMVDERELFPQPIKIQVWIKSVDSDVWCEVKLSRTAVGNAHLEDWLRPEYLPYAYGPIRQWYAYFEPNHFAAGEYDSHILITCKDPDNPSERMTCWDTSVGPDEKTDYYGMFLVNEG
ncbi:MAG: hypothetical protein ACFFDQ_12970 [Candidatus Thorarchaeota archaeon]